MIFFLKKQLIKFSCTYQPISFCKILKKFLELIQSYFHLPIGPFHCAKFKNFLQRILSYEDVPLLGRNWSICPKQIIFWNIIDIIVIYLLVSFIVQNFKKLFQRIQSYEGPKRPIYPKENFFRKPINEPYFFQFVLIQMPKIKVRY